jgi:hypothetical protein
MEGQGMVQTGRNSIRLLVPNSIIHTPNKQQVAHIILDSYSRSLSYGCYCWSLCGLLLLAGLVMSALFFSIGFIVRCLVQGNHQGDHYGSSSGSHDYESRQGSWTCVVEQQQQQHYE